MQQSRSREKQFSLFLNAHSAIKKFGLPRKSQKKKHLCVSQHGYYPHFSTKSTVCVAVLFKGRNLKDFPNLTKLKLHSHRMGTTSTTNWQLNAATWCSCIFNLFEAIRPLDLLFLSTSVCASSLSVWMWKTVGEKRPLVSTETDPEMRANASTWCGKPWLTTLSNLCSVGLRLEVKMLMWHCQPRRTDDYTARIMMYNLR